EAGLQALLARGDRRVADFLEMAAALDGDWRRALREWPGDAAFYTRRVRSGDETMPWDHFDVGVKKAGLLKEWLRAGLADPVTACARASSWPRWRTSPRGKGAWSTRRGRRSPSSTWTGPSTLSTTPARIVGGRWARAISRAAWPFARGTGGVGT